MIRIKNELRSMYHRGRYLLTCMRLKSNQRLRGLYEGQTCAIICTGSSIKNLDLTLLGKTPVLACNLFFRHPNAAALNYAGYFEIDPASSFLRNKEAYWNGGQYHRELAEFTRQVGARAFLRLGIEDFCRKTKAEFAEAIYLQSYELSATTKAIRTNIAGRFNLMDGVVYCMLGAAFDLGFKQIYLLGCDYTFHPIQSGHFYEDWIKHDYKDVDDRHKRLAVFFKNQGLSIFNVTPQGFESPAYEKISWDDAVARLN